MRDYDSIVSRSRAERMPVPPRPRHTHRRPPPSPKPKRYWTDLRFRHTASDDETANAEVARLVAAAETLGFDLELTRTRPHPPGDPLPA